AGFSNAREQGSDQSASRLTEDTWPAARFDLGRSIPRDLPEYFPGRPAGIADVHGAIRRMRNMTEVYFHYSNAEQLLFDSRGAIVNDLTEACAYAHRLVRTIMMTPNTEDWRGWELLVTDEFGAEIFVIPFSSALGKLH